MDPMNNPTPTPNPDAGMSPEPTPVPEPTPTPSPMSAPEPGVGTMPEAPMTPVGPAVPGAAPVNPIIQPGGHGLAATDPIMQPEPAPEPDPIEEELKAPMKAAEPAPGSIGSAVSGPTGAAPEEMPADNPFAAGAAGQTPNVSFTDPATQPELAAAAGAPAQPAKKNNKTLLIVLIAVAAVVVVVLIIVLIMQLTGGNSNSSSNSQSANNSVTVDEEEEESDSGNVATDGTLSCTRNMTEAEIVKMSDAASGTINISADFAEGMMTQISLVESVVYNDEDAVNTEPVENEVHESVAEDLTASSALNYYITADENGELDLSLDAIQANYENLDFTCEVL